MQKLTQAGKPPHLAWKKASAINLQVQRIFTVSKVQKMLKLRYSWAFSYAETEAKRNSFTCGQTGKIDLPTYGQTGNPNQKQNIANCFLASHHGNQKANSKRFILCNMTHTFQKTKYFVFNFQDCIDSNIVFVDCTWYCITTPDIIFSEFQHLLFWLHAIKRLN